MPAAEARFVVMLPAESWRIIPPPAPDEKLIEPVMDAAWDAKPRAKVASAVPIPDVSLIRIL